MDLALDEAYWNNRYLNQQIGWDIGYVSTPLKTYIDQLEDKQQRILIPGGGNSYEAEYLFQQGFTNVFVVDVATEPLNAFLKRVPNFPSSHLLHADFFELEQRFDLIIEQTFFCALNPKVRKDYVEKMHQLLLPQGKLVGLLFNDPLFTDHPPFGGNKAEYVALFKTHFEFKHFEIAYNSIKPRMDRELFICLIRNDEV